MIKTSLLATATFAVLLITQIDQVQAQIGNPFGNPCCGQYGILSSPYALSRVPEPPYFALHPPVYYSHAVPRTYGHSPFAYPGSVRTPDVNMDAPSARVLKNPYVTPTKSDKVNKPKINLKDVTKAVEPLEIINPFVDPAKTKMVSVEE